MSGYYMSDEEEEVTYGSLIEPKPKLSLAQELQKKEEAVKREAAFEAGIEATRKLLRLRRPPKEVKKKLDYPLIRAYNEALPSRYG
jgi:hypothetical protein